MDSTREAATRIYILVLTAAAAVALGGTLAIGGIGLGAFKATLFGKLADGNVMHRLYTGLPVIDEILGIPVSFWIPVFSRMQALRLQSMMLCASLQTFAVWAAIERMRKGEKHGILRWAPVYSFCWLYCGTAMLFPFYCFVELRQHFGAGRRASDPSVPYFQAKALLPAAIISFLYFYYLVYFPRSGMTESVYTTVIAYYQLGPFICYAIVAALANYLSSDHRSREEYPPNADARWIKANYAVFGLFSGAMHLSVVWLLLSSEDSSLSLSRVFIPQFGNLLKPDAAASLFVEETLFFLQWDFIFLAIVCSIYSFRISEGIYCPQQSGWPTFTGVVLGTGFGIACVVFGPGAVVSAMLWLREDFLRQDYAKKQKALLNDRTSSGKQR
ncbi:hypothetical protein MGYG_02808 [Nannizzia gypsea CBS 118893]|uniref:Uncharacterized protein n=1 Tax=Arthroderma gypseum (strain ATCC MYA-4604 / CBS 118893) TaxID=535722 RepID=E4UP70_ARTGP|nr:hypothetical protein MGYG_02808 [Nannizzia gypsea CBS 118893]EFQ99796.1 hypothetical protein MGYG_02808 [Nannizzia gypsea CBS 118893]